MCLLAARGRNRLAQTMGKITVDSPIPYLLSDLSNILQDEMGKLDKANLLCHPICGSRASLMN